MKKDNPASILFLLKDIMKSDNPLSILLLLINVMKSDPASIILLLIDVMKNVYFSQLTIRRPPPPIRSGHIYMKDAHCAEPTNEKSIFRLYFSGYG